MSKFNNNIQIKVFTGFAVLTVAIISLVYFILFNLEQSQKLIAKKSQIHELSDALHSVQQSNNIYISNAARDYESYYRDLEVYYKVLVIDIAAIDEKIENIYQTKKNLETLSQSVFNLIDSSQIKQLSLSIDNSHDVWKKFNTELANQFGDDIKEPRLEWGAKYIADNAGLVATQFNSLISIFDAISMKQSELSKTSGQITIAILLIFFIAFAVFFYLDVMRPLQMAKFAFQRVSEGDFGHQIRLQRHDEIGQLIHSFNQMSARSNSVLSILSKLQSVETLDEVVKMLFSQSKDYVGCDLVILVKPNLSHNGYTFNNIAPQLNFKNLYKANIPISSQAQITYMQNLFTNSTSVRINNIPRHVSQNREAEIMKALISRYPLKSAILQWLDTHNSENVFIVLASYNENSFTPQHIELLTHLIPFINHKLKAIDNKKPSRKNVVENKVAERV